MPAHYAADLSGVISTNGQLSGALGVAALGSWYLALATGGPAAAAHALAWVAAGFTALALCAAAAAVRARGTAANRAGPTADETRTAVDESYVRTGTTREMT